MGDDALLMFKKVNVQWQQDQWQATCYSYLSAFSFCNNVNKGTLFWLQQGGQKQIVPWNKAAASTLQQTATRCAPKITEAAASIDRSGAPTPRPPPSPWARPRTAPPGCPPRRAPGHRTARPSCTRPPGASRCRRGRRRRCPPPRRPCRRCPW